MFIGMGQRPGIQRRRVVATGRREGDNTRKGQEVVNSFICLLRSFQTAKFLLWWWRSGGETKLLTVDDSCDVATKEVSRLC